MSNLLLGTRKHCIIKLAFAWISWSSVISLKYHCDDIEIQGLSQVRYYFHERHRIKTNFITMLFSFSVVPEGALEPKAHSVR